MSRLKDERRLELKERAIKELLIDSGIVLELLNEIDQLEADKRELRNIIIINGL